MAKAVICPICKGRGKIPSGYVTTGTGTVVCHGCGGKGWVEVSDN